MRQIERRERFNRLFPAMPLWETWQEQRPEPTIDDPDNVRVVGHYKGIPRRVRRDMARQRSKREYRAANGLTSTTSKTP